MPNAVFIPAELNDLSVDVALGTPAQGAVMYRGAAKWNALAAGGAGQVLTSGGVNANPSWAPVSPDLSAAVVLAPNSVDRNLIQPTADANCALVLKNHSATLTGANPFEHRLSNGTLVTFITPRGDMTIGSTGAPGTVSFQFVDGALATGGITTLLGARSGAGFTYQINSASDTDVPLQLYPNSGTQSADLFQCYANDFSTTILRIGAGATGATSKIGFLGAAAAVRQTLPAAATDPATTQALANALRSLAITFGLAN